MSKIFNQSVIDFTQKSIDEINTELDLNYCSEKGISFPNDEVDTMTVSLYSKEVAEVAYGILHPEN